jgi:hypothetical protein
VFEDISTTYIILMYCIGTDKNFSRNLKQMTQQPAFIYQRYLIPRALYKGTCCRVISIRLF